VNTSNSPAQPVLQVGWINYWNLLPLKCELQRLASKEIEYQKGTPVQINKMLSDGRVTLAPCSSVCLLRSPQHEVALPLGVSSTGAVSSVYIGLQREHADVYERIKIRQREVRELFKQALTRQAPDARKVAAFVWAASGMQVTGHAATNILPPPLVVTPASATSSALARVLYRLWFGEEAFKLMAVEGSSGPALAGMSARRPLELLIGDEALSKRANFWQVIDLGEAWRELTDLPFVFAVWQTAKKPLSAVWRNKMIEAGEIAQARMKIEPSVYFPDTQAVDIKGNQIDLASYWKHINYRLGPAHFRGLALYLSLVRSMASEGIDDNVVCKIMRWEALAESPRIG
jgi:predicted solute-binding protein